MLLLCCCCCRGCLARLFPCALQFPWEPPQPRSSRAHPKRVPNRELGTGGSGWCVSHRHVSIPAWASRGITPPGHHPKQPVCKSFLGEEASWLQRGAGARRGAQKAAAKPECWLGREGAHGTGTVTLLGKTSSPPTNLGHRGEGELSPWSHHCETSPSYFSIRAAIGGSD